MHIKIHFYRTTKHRIITSTENWHL